MEPTWTQDKQRRAQNVPKMSQDRSDVVQRALNTQVNMPLTMNIGPTPGKNIPADLAPAQDFPKNVVSLWRQRDFMWQTTMKKKHPFQCGLQPLQGFVPQNPANEERRLFSSPHERSYSFASGGQQVEAIVEA